MIIQKGHLISNGDIFAVTKRITGYDLDDLRGKRRYRDIALVRACAMVCVREITPHSYTQIANMFARDHATIMHHVEAHPSRMKFEKDYIDTYRAISEAFVIKHHNNKKVGK